MNEANAAALLIDADNLSAAAIEQAFRHLASEGVQVTLRRAYGGHEKLASMRECLLRHGIRALVNNGKGTTDALLVVDAMDLLHAARLPAIVAIASSDGDFAPLALRLREAGIRVFCFAQSGKFAEEGLERCYERVIAVEGVAPPPPVAAPAPAPAPARAARKAPVRKAARKAPPPPPAAPPDPVRQVLESVDGFREGRWVPLNDVVKRLRADGQLGKNASGATFLKKKAPYVELSPPRQPNELRLAPDAR